MNLSELLDRIELKIQRLVRKTQTLQSELAALEEENQRLKEELARKETFVAVLRDALAHAQPTDNARTPDKQGAQYAEEVDKSIDWLNTN